MICHLVCKPKENGGIGIINRHIQDQALLTKHLRKFYNNAHVPWVNLIQISYYHGVKPDATILCGSFWWRDILELNDQYMAISSIKVNIGDFALFLSDAWLIEGSSLPLRHRLERLFSLPWMTLFLIKILQKPLIGPLFCTCQFLLRRWMNCNLWMVGYIAFSVTQPCLMFVLGQEDHFLPKASTA